MFGKEQGSKIKLKKKKKNYRQGASVIITSLGYMEGLQVSITKQGQAESSRTIVG